VSVVGRTLGHYKVLEQIGAGGMGEVYAAEDLRLRRRVALKVLPAAVASDPARRARFEREATALAALNHPNIVVVYSVEEADGIAFMTMELVEGRPLSAEIPAGGLPVARFFDLAIPLADAVAAAHKAGVVHRDLKPDNVVVGAGGRVKVLDFGLAKLRDDEAASSSGSASVMPTRHLTGQGQIVGTVSYMSPEQVEGRPIDQRTDVFSLGVVLYEMATGKRPFQGDSPASIISSILRDAPQPASVVNRGLPRHLTRIVRQCLAKDAEERTQSARDVRNQLVDLRREIDSGAVTPGEPGAQAGPVPRGRLLAAAMTGAAVMAAIAAALLFWRGGSGSPAAVSTGALAMTQQKLTDAPGEEITPSVSPDGKFVVYASRSTGNFDIYSLRVGGSLPANLTKDSPADDREPAFSPDGSRIAFRSERDGGGIYLMGATGESVVRLANFGYRPSWSPDGAHLVVATADFDIPTARPSRSELWTIDTADGKSRKIYDGDAVQPAWSPNGKRIAFWAIPPTSGQRDVWTIPADGGTPVPVTQDASVDWSPAWEPDGKALYFGSDRGGSMNVWRAAIDEASGSVTGAPEPVTFGAASEIASPSLSKDGREMVAVASVLFDSVYRVSLDIGRATARVDPSSPIRTSNGIIWMDLSPDGRWLAYSTAATGGRPGFVREEIVVAASDGSSRRSVAVSDSRNRLPRWSPDGTHIAFASDRDGGYQIYTVRADGSELQRMPATGLNAVYSAWSPDGKRLAVSTAVSKDMVMYIADWPPSAAKPEEISTKIGEQEGNFVPHSWSSDGSLLAGHIQGRGGDEPGGILVYRFATHDYETITTSGCYPRWMPDNRHLVYAKVNTRSLFVVDRVTKETREMPLDLRGTTMPFSFTLSHDGKTAYLVEEDLEADLWKFDLRGATRPGG
jgi:Tol biopolymer transport system component